MIQKRLVLAVSIALAMLAMAALGFAQQGSPSPSSTKAVGVVQSVDGNTFVVKTDAGPVARVRAQETTRILRSSPEQKSLKDAVPMQAGDIQTGDRMLAAGKPADDGAIVASTIVVMKKADVAQKQQKEMEDWQRRGVGGLVSSMDVPSRTIKIGISGLGQKREVTIHAGSTTVIRRYAAGSVKFEDAKLGTLDQIKPGDQLRARGDRSADGSELTAEEIVSGTFRNISGTLSAADPAAGTITVNDLVTKKPAHVKITPETQMRKLPEMMARILAARLKGDGQPGGNGAFPEGVANGRAASGASANGGERASNGDSQPHPGAGGFGGPMGARPGRGDLPSVLNRAPALALTDLQKGDAVMLVATEGSDGAITGITLLSGVEPILTASPSASFLSPWNLGGGGGAEGGDAGGGPQ